METPTAVKHIQTNPLYSDEREKRYTRVEPDLDDAEMMYLEKLRKSSSKTRQYKFKDWNSIYKNPLYNYGLAPKLTSDPLISSSSTTNLNNNNKGKNNSTTAAVQAGVAIANLGTLSGEVIEIPGKGVLATNYLEKKKEELILFYNSFMQSDKMRLMNDKDKVKFHKYNKSTSASSASKIKTASKPDKNQSNNNKKNLQVKYPTSAFQITNNDQDEDDFEDDRMNRKKSNSKWNFQPSIDTVDIGNDDDDDDNNIGLGASIAPLKRLRKGDEKRFTQREINERNQNIIPIFPKRKLVLGRSSIHAWGVFAGEPFSPNDVIIEYVGEYIRSVVSDIREKIYNSLNVSDYMFKTKDGDKIIDATRMGSIARFINHSCDPNCFSDPRGDRIFIIAEKSIRVGEELLYDYLLSQDDIRIPCHCGSKNCKGFMN